MKKSLFTLLFFYSITSQAQSLDLVTCLQMADTANATLRNARLDVEINEKQRDAYVTAKLPKVSFTGDYKYNALIPGQVVPAALFGGPPGQYATLKFGVPYNFNNSFQVSQVLYNPQVNYGLRALAINQQVVEIQSNITELEIKNQVATTFYNLQAITKQLSFIEGNIVSMDKIIANLNALYSNGLILETEVDKMKLNRLNLESTKASISVTKIQLESLLKILIGKKESESIQLVSDEAVEKSILQEGNTTISHPELSLLQAQKAFNIEERKGTNMAYLPSLAAYAAYQYNYNVNPKDDFRTGIPAAVIGLQLNWTLFDGLEKYKKQKVNALNLEKIETQTLEVTQQLDMQVKNAQLQIVAQSNALEYAKEKLSLSEKIVKQSEIQFSNGTINSTDLISVENSLQEAQTALIAAYVNLRQAEISFLKLTGNLK